MIHQCICLQGVNFESINQIVYEREYITFKESLLILEDPNVHPLLQSAYLDFVISAFVDYNVEESGVDVDNMWHCYVSYDQQVTHVQYDGSKLFII